MASEDLSETRERNQAKPSLADLRSKVVGQVSESFQGTQKSIQALDREANLRSQIDRERRLRVAEQSERIANMKSAMRKANEIIHDEDYRILERALREDLEFELKQLESQVLEREEAVLKQELQLRLDREQEQLKEALSLRENVVSRLLNKKFAIVYVLIWMMNFLVVKPS